VFCLFLHFIAAVVTSGLSRASYADGKNCQIRYLRQCTVLHSPCCATLPFTEIQCLADRLPDRIEATPIRHTLSYSSMVPSGATRARYCRRPRPLTYNMTATPNTWFQVSFQVSRFRSVPSCKGHRPGFAPQQCFSATEQDRTVENRLVHPFV
jgi:hypothetical protein